MTEPFRPALAALEIADPPERWQALGFEVHDARVQLGGIELRLGVPGRGITGWSLRGVTEANIDGLPTTPVDQGPTSSSGVAHPNGALGVDHVVVVTPDFARTSKALEHAGIPLRRIRTEGPFRQGFRRLGPAILELVDAGDTMAASDGLARFWGLVVIVSDLAALAARLEERLGSIKPAVQPGRRIATLRDSAGLAAKVAFMDPEPPASALE